MCYIFFLVKVALGWIRIGIHPKMLDADPESMNPDPKHWYQFEIVKMKQSGILETSVRIHFIFF